MSHWDTWVHYMKRCQFLYYKGQLSVPFIGYLHMQSMVPFRVQKLKCACVKYYSRFSKQDLPVCTGTPLFNIHKQGKARWEHLLKQDYTMVLRAEWHPFHFPGAWGSNQNPRLEALHSRVHSKGFLRGVDHVKESIFILFALVHLRDGRRDAHHAVSVHQQEESLVRVQLQAPSVIGRRDTLQMPISGAPGGGKKGSPRQDAPQASMRNNFL